MIEGVIAGKIIVDCATLSPERMNEINEKVSARGGHFLEAPVSGSKVRKSVTLNQRFIRIAKIFLCKLKYIGSC